MDNVYSLSEIVERRLRGRYTFFLDIQKADDKMNY